MKRIILDGEKKTCTITEEYFRNILSRIGAEDLPDLDMDIVKVALEHILRNCEWESLDTASQE